MRTFLVWVESGGPLVVPVVIVGIATIALLIEQTISIVVRSKIHARPFIEAVISLVRADRLDEALQLCADHQAALPDLGLVILRTGSRDEEDLASIARSARLTMIPSLTRRLSWLPTLAILALLLGFLGAVANLHDALMNSTPAALAVAFALRPIGIALIAAVPAVVGHALLVSEARKLAAQLEEFSARLLNALVDRPDVRLGHRG
ncbi:MAG: MotA/TolQ/ExbB proton channel family protein [Gemmatimonadaceae bacterium]